MSRYIRKEILNLDEGLRIISLYGWQKSTLGFRTGGLRLRTFREKGTCCAYCGLEATHFAVEKCSSSSNEHYHLNLWGVKDGREVLFTHDHIYARGLGGADAIENSVTACENCNSRKSRIEGKIANKYKKTLDFTSLISLIKETYIEPHIRKFWFIAE